MSDSNRASVTNYRCAGGGFSSALWGEEFALVLPETDQQAVIGIAQTIRHNIAALTTSHLSEIPTVSIGIACMIPRVEFTRDYLLNQADKALYLAKQQGRDQVCVA